MRHGTAEEAAVGVPREARRHGAEHRHEHEGRCATLATIAPPRSCNILGRRKGEEAEQMKEKSKTRTHEKHRRARTFSLVFPGVPHSVSSPRPRLVHQPVTT